MPLILLKTIALAGGAGNPLVEPPLPLALLDEPAEPDDPEDGWVEAVGADGPEELFPVASLALELEVPLVLVPAAEAGEPATVFAGPVPPQPASNMVRNKPEKETSVESIGWLMAPPGNTMGMVKR